MLSSTKISPWVCREREMISLGTGNSPCFPVMVSSEICKKRRINQGFPTVRDFICHTKRENLAYPWRVTASPSNSYHLPPLNRRRHSWARHKFWCLSGKEDLNCPFLSSTCCNLEPSPVTLSVASGEQLGCPPLPCKQQTTRKTLTWWLPKSCQGQDIDCHLLKQQLATAWTCSCRHKECELCDVGLNPAQSSLVVPSSKKSTNLHWRSY